MKKFKLKKRKFKPNKVYSPEKLLKCIIDSELGPYGKVLEDINTEENGIINGLKWFEYYTFKTPSQERVWYEYCNKLIRKHWLPWYISKKEADKHLSMVRLNYGLKSEYIISKLEKNEN